MYCGVCRILMFVDCGQNGLWECWRIFVEVEAISVTCQVWEEEHQDQFGLPCFLQYEHLPSQSMPNLSLSPNWVVRPELYSPTMLGDKEILGVKVLKSLLQDQFLCLEKKMSCSAQANVCRTDPCSSGCKVGISWDSNCVIQKTAGSASMIPLFSKTELASS